MPRRVHPVAQVLLSFLAASTLMACGGTRASTEQTEPSMTPPVAKLVPHALEDHGQTRQDPYYWMRSDDRSDEEVLSHLAAENAYAEQELAPLSGFRESLFEEIVARIPKDDESVPYRLDGYWYYRRVEEGKEYPIYCRRAGTMEADEQVILDANAEAEGHDYYSAKGLTTSVNGEVMAYGEDLVSRRIYTLKFKNLMTGEMLPDEIPGTSGGAVWALDNQTVFYVKKEEGTLREYQVWRHTLGTDAAADVLVYEEEDAEFYLGISRSRSRDYVLIGSYQTLSHEYRYVDAREPTSDPVVFLPRESAHEYDIDHYDGRFYVRTNWEARDFRLMSAASAGDAATADKATWREEIPSRDGVFLIGFELFQNHLVVSERREGIARLNIIPWADRTAAHEVAFEETAFYSSIGTNSEVETTTLRLDYTSMTTPWSVFDYDMNAKEMTLRKRNRVEGDFDQGAYTTTRISAEARDGTAVPISIVHRRDLDRSTPQPLLLYGYGAYGYSMDPTFSSTRISLLDRGFIFAIAHIRGGQELGRAWYEDGRLLNKRHTFEDFIDCGEHLAREGWTAADRLFAHGGSAGGLLVGAVANMRPDLFRGIVADVPFVDVVTTMLDESIPLTTFEYDEWGNPNDRAYYDYMMTYSPYDNVEAQDYPNMLVITGLHDSQVQYWEPMKWVARLREMKTDDNRLLFHVNMEAGHGGASGRFRRHKETALIYAFLLDLVGVRR